jgi:hypothetical protein
MLVKLSTRSVLMAWLRMTARIEGSAPVRTRGHIQWGRRDQPPALRSLRREQGGRDTLVRVLAQELGPRGVTVNSVLPGATRTDALATGGVTRMAEELAARTPLGHLGEPDDIAEIVAFLVAASSRWITGQAIHAGGGLF